METPSSSVPGTRYANLPVEVHCQSVSADGVPAEWIEAFSANLSPDLRTAPECVSWHLTTVWPRSTPFPLVAEVVELKTKPSLHEGGSFPIPFSRLPGDRAISGERDSSRVPMACGNHGETVVGRTLL